MGDCTVSAEERTNQAPDCSIVAEKCAETAENFPIVATKDVLPFRWTGAARKAAVLVAEDQISNAAISQACLISPRTLSTWKQHPDFRAEIEKHKLLTAEDINAFSIARKIERVRALDTIHTKLTGLVGTAKEPDPAYLKEVREYQRQAAIEVGQWQEGGAGQQLKPGEQRVSVTYEAIQQLQTADPERWGRIQRAAAGIVAEERALPAGRQVVDAGTPAGGKP